MKKNMVGWFEIPVIDMERATAFYNKVFDIEIQLQNFEGELMGWFPFVEGGEGAAGALIMQNELHKPNSHGVLVYFASEDVQIELDRVEGAGGIIVQEKTQISPEVGCYSSFIDTEGNRLSLHSRR
jgi:predicted enzyme related to lactoylglutathione lyase